MDALITDEQSLVAALRARADELNVSRAEIDRVAGLTNGHASKLLCVPPIKYFGRQSFWAVVGSLGLAVQLVVDPQATARFASKMEVRDRRAVRKHAILSSNRIPWLINASNAREMGKKGAKIANGQRSPTRMKKDGRKGALIRWEKVKKVVNQSKP